MKKKFRSMKITYMISSFSVILLFTVTISTIWLNLYQTQLSKSTSSNVNYMLESANAQFDSMLTDLHYSMVALGLNDEFLRIIRTTEYDSDSQMISDRRAMESLLRTSMTRTSNIIEWSVITSSGFYYSRGAGNEMGEDKIEEYFTLVKEGNTSLAITPSMPDESEDEKNLRLTMIMLINRGLNSESIIVVTINCSVLLDSYYTNLGFPYGLVLYDLQEGKMIYQDNMEMIGMENAPALQEISDKTILSNAYTMVKLNNREYMLSSYLSSVTGWQSIVLIPKDTLTANYADATRFSIILIGVVLLVSIAVTLIIASLLTKNINQFSRAIENIDSEKLELNVQIHAYDEVGILYNKFLQLIERIKGQMDVIRQNESEKRKLEIKALQAQINPHFLYNNLSTIKFMADKQGCHNVYEAIDALNTIMYINMAKEEYMTLEQEVAYIKSFVCLKEYQLSKPIHLLVDLNEPVRYHKILKLLIQPIVENCIKHGNIHEKEDGFIALKIYEEDGYLMVSIKDNGIGMSESFINKMLEKLPESKSIGIFNVMERIRLNYGEGYGIAFTGEKGVYTQVDLCLPLIDTEREN